MSMFHKDKSDSTGFTLIELLVVIAIIGLLSSIVLTSLNSAKMKARDARRIMDLQQLKTAMDLYYDKFGKYPGETICNDESDGAFYCGGSGGPPNNWDAESDLRRLVSEGFISVLPIDPINDDFPYVYMYEPDNSGQGNCPSSPPQSPCEYQIRATLERGEVYCVGTITTRRILYGCPLPDPETFDYGG